MKGVVVTCPTSKQPIRLMPGSLSLELYLEKGKSNKADATYKLHMKALHAKYLKEIGRA
jgi:hypothetical protein